MRRSHSRGRLASRAWHAEQGGGRAATGPPVAGSARREQAAGHVQDLARAVVPSSRQPPQPGGELAGQSRTRSEAPAGSTSPPSSQRRKASASGAPGLALEAGPSTSPAALGVVEEREGGETAEASRLAQGALDLGVGFSAAEPPPPHHLHARGLEGEPAQSRHHPRGRRRGQLGRAGDRERVLEVAPDRIERSAAAPPPSPPGA